MDDKKMTQDFVEFHKENKLCTAVERDGVICWNGSYCFNLCNKHYQRVRKYNSVNLPTKARNKCRFIDCESDFYAKGYCNKHYKKFHKRSINKKKTVKCSIENCEMNQMASNLCSKHYNRLKRHGDINKVYPNAIKLGLGNGKTKKYLKCIVKNCDIDSDKQEITRGLCRKHYYRWIKNGDYNKVLRIRKSK